MSKSIITTSSISDQPPNFHKNELVTYVRFVEKRNGYKAITQNGFIEDIEGNNVFIRLPGESTMVCTDIYGINSIVNARVLYHGHDIELITGELKHDRVHGTLSANIVMSNKTNIDED